MSLINKLSTLFSPKVSQNHLGISVRQNALAVCAMSPSKGNTYHEITVDNLNYTKAIDALSGLANVQGELSLVLPTSLYQIVQIDKPDVPETEVRSALKWLVKDLVTIDPNDMVVDYFNSCSAGTKEKINVVCAQASILKGFIDHLADDIHLTSIITEEFAFAQLMPVREQAVLLVCKQPNEEVLIIIVKNGELHFHRRLRGYAQLGGKTEEELTFGTIDSLSLEIQRSTDYYERSLKQLPIKEIHVLLPVKTEAFIARKLAENTHIAVSLFNFSPPEIPADISSRKNDFSAAFGALNGFNVAASRNQETSEIDTNNHNSAVGSQERKDEVKQNA